MHPLMQIKNVRGNFVFLIQYTHHSTYGREVWTFRPAITCSKLTIETLEQGVKYAIRVVMVSFLLTLNIFHTLF